MDTRKRFANSRIEVETIEAWIEAGWIAPSEGEAEHSDIHLARAQLIHHLRHEFGVNDEGIPIVLDLIDQVHGLRRAVRELMRRTRD